MLRDFTLKVRIIVDNRSIIDTCMINFLGGAWFLAKEFPLPIMFACIGTFLFFKVWFAALAVGAFSSGRNTFRFMQFVFIVFVVQFAMLMLLQQFIEWILKKLR